MLDGKLVSGTHHLLHVARELRWIGVRIAAREAAADVDGINHDARGHDQLPDLPERLAEGGRHDSLRADVEGDAESPRNLPRTKEKLGRHRCRGAELALERNEAVRIRTGDAEVEIEILCPACLLDDLVELVVAVEGEASHAVFAIGAHDGTARLDRVHEEQLGVCDRGEPLDFDERGDIEGADAGLD